MQDERLWAPWRMAYIDGSDRDDSCIFCTKPHSGDDRGNLVIHRGDHAFVMMNKFPYNNGHLMVAPYRHIGDFLALNDDEMLDIMRLAQKMIAVIRDTMNPAGFNTGFNIGSAAGAGIADHLHFHIVPRWIGDTNFMPVVGGTKVISEHILDTYDKIVASLTERGEG